VKCCCLARRLRCRLVFNDGCDSFCCDLGLTRYDLDLGHGAVGGFLESALAADLNGNRFGTAVREALPDLTGLDRLVQLKPTRMRQAELPFQFLFFSFCLLCHLSSTFPIRSAF
jgi:hypothetical protein